MPPPRDRLDAVVAELGDLATSINDHADRLYTHDNALREVCEQLTALTTAVEKATAQRKKEEEAEEERRPWCWADMTTQQHADRLNELLAWVLKVLRGRFLTRDSVRKLPACWPYHPAIVEELSGLYGIWCDTYRHNDGTKRDAAEWLERWFHQFDRRLTDNHKGETEHCPELHGEHLKDAEAHGWAMPASLRVERLQAQARTDADAEAEAHAAAHSGELPPGTL